MSMSEQPISNPPPQSAHRKPAFRLRDFAAESRHADAVAGEVDLRIELGSAKMAIRDAKELTPGSLVVLDRLANDPVDVVAAGRLVGRGQVVIVDGKFGVRVTELIVANMDENNLE
jgi:flagellar motor switch protein FliN